jgi:hypothetical protein
VWERRRVAVLSVWFVAAWALHAQTPFGQGVPEATPRGWRAQNTPYVRLFFLEGTEPLAATTLGLVAEAAEDISKRLDVAFTEPPTWLLFPSFRSLVRSNVPGDDVSEGLRSWTPLLRHRTVIVFEGVESRLRTDVRHAVTHAIQAQTLHPSAFRQTVAGGFLSHPPDWFLEGMALYFAGTPEAQDEIILRGASLDNRLLTLEELHDFNRVDDLPLAYMEGFSAVSYLVETHGEAILGELLKALAQGRRMDDALEATLDLDVKTLNKQWQRAVKKRYWPLVRMKASPESVATVLDPDRLGDVSDLAWTPSGEVLACVVQTFRRDELRLISAKDGSTLRVVATFGTNTAESLERRGRAISWSPDGDSIVYIAYDGRRTRLTVIDVITGKRTKRLDIPFEEAFSPTYFPDGKRVLFVGVAQDRADLYAADLDTGRITQITDDDAFDAEPSVHPSGERVLYVSERGAAMRLVERDLLTGEYQLVFDGAPGVRMPSWNRAGDSFVFTADWNGTRDVYSATEDGSGVARITNLLVGAETPSVSPDGKRLVFSAQRRSRESAFVLTLSESKAESVIPPVTPADAPQPDAVASYPAMGLPRELLWDDMTVRFRTDADGRLRGSAQSLFASWTGDTRFNVRLDTVYRGLPGLAATLDAIGRRWDIHVGGASQGVFHRTSDGSLAEERATNLMAGLVYPLTRATRLSATSVYSRSPLRYRFEALPIGMAADASGGVVVIEAAVVHDTALVSSSLGALTGKRARLAVSRAFGAGFAATTLSFDGRRYLRLGIRTALATRLYGAMSSGATPERLTLGGHTTLRASDFEAFRGSRVGFVSVELRVPLLDELRLGWPVRFGITSVRGIAFVESGTTWSETRRYRLSERVNGRRHLVDLSLQYGFGLRLRVKDTPIRLDFARDDDLLTAVGWRTILRLDEDF